MTENNTGDRRFWMVVAEHSDDNVEIVKNITGTFRFTDDKEAADVAEKTANGCKNSIVYVVEAVSRFVLPEPKVVKQNLHIPPLSPREA